ncbi:hypothetical protein [Paenibacillus taichungensis]|uniref:hypothetical protein n=1 Tax=Paenibacillus taichungensis TaxID=484184 RepID=UPI0039A687BE
MVRAHPDEKQVNTSASENAELKLLLADMQANPSEEKNFNYNGENYLLFYNPIPSTG